MCTGREGKGVGIRPTWDYVGELTSYKSCFIVFLSHSQHNGFVFAMSAPLNKVKLI